MSAPILLAIDDDPLFLLAVKASLEKVGIKTTTVSTRLGFFEQLEKIRPDLLLVDLNLEGCTGIDIIREVRLLSQRTPIVVASSERDPSAVAHALETGANDFILKPFDRTLLVTKLFRFVETEELDNSRARYKSFPQGPVSAKLSWEVEIDEIDELGVKFVGRSLIPKGTTIRLRSKLFPGFLPLQEEEIPLTVSNTWFEPRENRYGAYADFDATNMDLMEAVKRWLLNKNPK